MASILVLAAAGCGGPTMVPETDGGTIEIVGDDDARQPDACPGVRCTGGEVLHDLSLIHI